MPIIGSPTSGVVTDADILDIAMVALGEKLYSEMSITDDAYRAANKLYALKRDAVLADHPWNGCVAMVLLVATGQTPLFQWAYEYIYPADALRILRIDPGVTGAVAFSSFLDPALSPTTMPVMPWEIGWDVIGQQKSVWCNLTPASCRYIFRNTNVATYSPFLAEAIAARMAMELASALTAHQGKFANLAKVYQDTMSFAKLNDGQEQSPTVVLSTTLTTDVRDGG